MKPSIIRLRALEKQLYAYLYAMTVIDFDAETVAPEAAPMAAPRPPRF